jgi:hydrogenase maturation factor
MTELIVRSKDGKRDMVAKIDWRKRKKLQYVSVSIGDVNTKLLASDIWALAFAISELDEQEKLIPSKLMEVRKIEKMVKVKAKEDIKAGDFVTFKVGFDLTPMDIEGEAPPTTGGFAEQVD